MPVSPSHHHLVIWVSDGRRKGVPYVGNSDGSDLWGSTWTTPSASGVVSLLEIGEGVWSYMEGKEKLGSAVQVSSPLVHMGSGACFLGGNTFQ